MVTQLGFPGGTHIDPSVVFLEMTGRIADSYYLFLLIVSRETVTLRTLIGFLWEKKLYSLIGPSMYSLIDGIGYRA